MQFRLHCRGRSMALALVCQLLTLAGNTVCAAEPGASAVDPFDALPVVVASDDVQTAPPAPPIKKATHDAAEPKKLAPAPSSPKPVAAATESGEPAHLPAPRQLEEPKQLRESKPIPAPRPVDKPRTEPTRLAPPEAKPVRSVKVTKPKAATTLKVEEASFRGVRPGKSKLTDVETALGTGKEAAHNGNSRTLVYAIKPFQQVQITLVDDVVTSLAMGLARAHTPAELVERLKLDNVRSVEVPNEEGQAIGRAFPDRGVLFSYSSPGGQEVDQILLEVADPQAFVLRAESQLHGPYAANLADLDYAIERDPGNAHAQWLRGRIWLAVGDLDQAAESLQAARKLEPRNTQYRLTQAQCLSQQGYYDKSLAEVKAVLALADLEPIVRAQASLQLGDLMADGPVRDDQQAIEAHQQAIALADPLSVDPRVAIRRSAKEILINAHLSVARDVGWGNWNRKPEVVPKWIDRAMAFADEMIDNDGGSAELRLRVLEQALAACVAFKPSVNPTPLVEEAEAVATELFALHDDTLWRQRIHWQLGRACSQAVRIAHARGDFDQGIKFAELAQTHLEEGAEPRQNNLQSRYEVGRLYFSIGALHAVHHNDHQAAVDWYDKAIGLLIAKDQVDAADPAHVGEALVSMGVSYWDVDMRQKAMELTQQGAKLIEQAVERGLLRRSALVVPYGNLASMHREMGDKSRAQSFNQLAEKSEAAERR